MKNVTSQIINIQPACDDSIPVIVDDVKNYEGFEMSRCTYFTIESDLPSPGWLLTLKNLKIPFCLLGLSGIVSAPLTEKNRFDNADAIAALFEKIESETGLYIAVNDIWLPNSLFKKTAHKRGCVYRIATDLFIKAFQYRHNRLPHARFVGDCRELRGRFIYSSGETDSFVGWAQRIVENAKKIYPKNRQFALKRRADKPEKAET